MRRLADEAGQRQRRLLGRREITHLRPPDRHPAIGLDIGIGASVAEVAIGGEDVEIELVRQMVDKMGDAAHRPARAETGEIVVNQNQNNWPRQRTSNSLWVSRLRPFKVATAKKNSPYLCYLHFIKRTDSISATLDKSGGDPS